MNLFGQPAAQGPTTPAAFFPLFDSELVKANRQHFRREMFNEIKRANSYYSPAGRWPATGWILMRHGDYSQLNPYRTDMQLQIDDLVNPPLTFSNLTVVQARCVTCGVPNHPDSIYLVQITDGQGIIYNPWFQYPITTQYNVRAPAYPETYYASSLNAGVPWTWDGMCQDIWNKLGTFLGAYPGLPIVPSGTPENFIFPGVSGWEALNNLLDLLGLSIADTPLAATPRSIVVAGADDPVFDALQAKAVGNLQDDYPFLDSGSGRVPGRWLVFFHRRNQYYGTEETVRSDSLQWSSTPFYTVTVNSPAPYDVASGTGYLWDDFTVRYDIDGNPLAADTVTALAIATERVTQTIDTIHRGTAGMMHQVYTGALPFQTGSLVDCVRWAHGAYITPDGQERWGWRTEIFRGFQPDEVTFFLSGLGLRGV